MNTYEINICKYIICRVLLDHLRMPKRWQGRRVVSWLLKEGFLHKYKSKAFLVRFEVGPKRDWQKRRQFYSDLCYIVYRFHLGSPLFIFRSRTLYVSFV